MLETLRGKGRFYLMCIVCILCLFGVSNNILKKETQIGGEANPSIDDLKKGEDMISNVVMILECDERTAQSILEQIETQVGEEIKDVKSKKETGITMLFLDTESGEKYTAIIGLGYTLDEIFKGDENGERIYWSMD